MMKNICKFLLYFFICFGSIFFNHSFIEKVNASSKLEIDIKNPKKVKLAEYKDIKMKIYYDGKNVSSSAKVKIKNKNKKIFKVDKDDGLNENFKEFTICPDNIGKGKVEFTVTYNPIWDYDSFEEEEKIMDFWSEHDEFDTYKEAETVYWNTHKKVENKLFKKKIKCVINVNPYKNLTVYASLDEYNTRTNVFSMDVSNMTNKTITIYSNGAGVYDFDYTAFDRSVRLTGGRKSISIKPGKSKTIYFYVVGSLTWYDVEDFELCSYWNWGAHRYRVSVQYRYASAYIGGRWKQISITY